MRLHHQNPICLPSFTIRATYSANLILRSCSPSCFVGSENHVSPQAVPSIRVSLIPSKFQIPQSTQSANVFHSIRKTRLYSDTRPDCTAIQDQNVQRYKTIMYSDTRPECTAIQDQNVQRYKTRLYSDTRPHSTAIQDQTVQRYKTTQYSDTRPDCTAIQDHTVQRYKTKMYSDTDCIAIQDHKVQRYKTRLYRQHEVFHYSHAILPSTSISSRLPFTLQCLQTVA